MFFKGTEKRPTARDLSMEVDKIGGEFNAFTSKEYTGYYIRCAGEQRDVALDVLVDMLRNSKFDGEELEREKGVIIEEMNMYIDTPRDYVSSVYEELLFGSNPLGWETLGTRETIKDATRQTFLDYLGHWYTPQRMVVGVSGMIGDDLLPTLEGLLGDMPGNGTGTPAPAQVERSSEPKVRIHRKDSDQANVCLGLPSYPLDHPDRYALQLLGTVLGTGMSSRLFLEVREQRGLAYYVYALNAAFTDAGTLFSQAGVDLKRAEEAVEVIAAEFRKLADGGRAGRGARKGACARQGAVRPADREPERADHVRAAPRGAGRAGGRADRGARRPRRRHRRRRAAGRAGRDRRSGHAARRDRAVRRRVEVRGAALVRNAGAWFAEADQAPAAHRSVSFQIGHATTPLKTSATARNASSFQW